MDMQLVVWWLERASLVQVLAATQQGGDRTAVRLQALAALRAHLGSLAGGSAANGKAERRYAWAAAALAAMVPSAAAHAHQLLAQQRQTAADDMQVLGKYLNSHLHLHLDSRM